MKNTFTTLLMILCCSFLLAQEPEIIKLEYFFDTDPGNGLATNIPITSTSEFDMTITPDISSLSEGIHRLFIRVKDDSDRWSMTKSHTFFKGINVLNQSINKIEYYFDSDPGFGNATPVSFNPSTDMDLEINLDVSTLSNGIHRLYIRAQDEAGQWSTTKSHTFYKGIFSTGETSNIISVEYFVDTDPGYGNGNNLVFTPDSDLDLTFDIDMSTLEETTHTLFIRVLDADSSWSLIQKHPFCFAPEKCATPSGATELCINSGNSTYTTVTENSATAYLWNILPEEAGTITGNDTVATVDWSDVHTGEVQIFVFGENSCGQGISSDTLIVNISASTSVESLTDNDFKIFPNPSNGFVNIKTIKSREIIHIKITNIQGQSIYEGKIKDHIQLELNCGVYFVSIMDNKKVITKQLIINK